MNVAIVRYNAGNTRSIVNALERIGAHCTVTDDPDTLLSAERVIFPGVGEASSAMKFLKERGLDETLRAIKAPLLGVCLGLQLLCASSEEGNIECLGILPQRVRRFSLPRKVPHMGWSRVSGLDHPVFDGIASGSFFYFVHSYRLDLGPESIAECTYEERFAAAAAKGNFVGVQFHPEKSAQDGEQVLRNFLRWKI